MKWFNKILPLMALALCLAIPADAARSVRVYNSNNVELKLESDGAVAVNIQDQTSPPIIAKFYQNIGETTLTSDLTLNDYIIPVASVADLSVGGGILFVDPTNTRFSYAHITAINTLDVTIDTPVDFGFNIANTTVVATNHDMNILGSMASPQIFTVRGGDPEGLVNITLDITRIIIQATCVSAVSLDKFGDLTALTNGIVLRRSNGTILNMFNAKKNYDLSGVAFDFKEYTSDNPAQGIDGFSSRLTFAGQNKMGVAIRLAPGEDLEIWIQDDLTGLTEFTITFEGHIVVP
jgi:hypothetical protein